jgi:hypothetical protein
VSVTLYELGFLYRSGLALKLFSLPLGARLPMHSVDSPRASSARRTPLLPRTEYVLKLKITLLEVEPVIDDSSKSSYRVQSDRGQYEFKNPFSLACSSAENAGSNKSYEVRSTYSLRAGVRSSGTIPSLGLIRQSGLKCFSLIGKHTGRAHTNLAFGGVTT